jgi:transglutaminase-like putative cysteine protease
MRKTVKATIIIIVLITGLSAFTQCYPNESPKDYIKYELKIEVSFWNKGPTTYYLTDQDLTIGLFQNNSYQTSWLKSAQLKNGDTPINYVWGFDVDDNANVLFNLSNRALAPNRQITLAYIYTISVKTRSFQPLNTSASWSLTQLNSSAEYLQIINDYCKPAGVWLYNNTNPNDHWVEINQLARDLKGSSDNMLEILYNFVDWMGKNVNYNVGNTQYPNETYASKKGKCDDQANLLISMCRCVGIPAYLQTGCIYLLGEKEVNMTGYNGHVTWDMYKIGWHAWAMVFLPPWGWIPFDITWGYPVKKTPESAYFYSAIMSVTTVCYQNIKTVDYIAEDERVGNNLVNNNLYIHEVHSMYPVELTQMSFIFRYETILVTSVVLALTVVTTLFAYFWARSRKISTIQRSVTNPTYSL